MSEPKFVDGLFVNQPHERAPSFVKCGISFKPDEFIDWLRKQEPNEKGYVRLQVKEGKSGKWYASVDDYKPGEKKAEKPATKVTGKVRQEESDFVDDDIPF